MRSTLLGCVVVVAVFGGGDRAIGQGPAQAPPQVPSAPVLTAAEFDRIFNAISNWGRWGKDDQAGTYNLITPEKRKQAAALVKTGQSVSLSHPVFQEKAPDVANIVLRTSHGNKVAYESVHGGAYHSHIDALCHMQYKGKVYNGIVQKEIELEDRCSKMALEVYKGGFVTRGVLIDMPRFKGVPWLEPGTPVTRQDIEAWEKKTGVKVLPGDAVFLRTGRWARRAKVGPTGFGAGDIMAGYHWSVLEWFKARDVAIISDEGPNDVRPAFVEPALGGLLPIHIGALAGMGAVIFDGQDLDAVGELAARLNRYEFMMTAAPSVIEGATGISLNVIATF